MTNAYTAWLRRLTVITALILGFAAGSVVDAGAHERDRRDRREDRREYRQERRHENRQDLRRKYRQDRRIHYRQDRRRHRDVRVVVTQDGPHCGPASGYIGSRVISLGTDRFHWSASLGFYVPSFWVEARYGESAPRGNLYYDPYCRQTYRNLSAYRAHLQGCGHPAAIMLADDPDLSVASWGGPRCDR